MKVPGFTELNWANLADNPVYFRKIFENFIISPHLTAEELDGYHTSTILYL